MSTITGLAFLLVYVLGAFAYGSALTLSLRQASPVWSPHRRHGTPMRRRLDRASLVLFAWSAVWFVVLALDQFGDLVATHRAGNRGLNTLELVLVFGFPPLIMHTMFLEGHCAEWPPRAAHWARRGLMSGYAGAIGSGGLALAIVADLVNVPRASMLVGSSLGVLFTVAGVYSAIVMNRNPRVTPTADYRKLRRALNGLFAMLVTMNVLFFATGGPGSWFEIFNRVMGVAPLLFLSATTYYENPFEFYDLLVKRGAMLMAGMLLLGAYFSLALPWLDGLPADATRPWIYALTAVPLMLAAPWLARRLGNRLDRAWFGRHHTPVSAVTTVLASMQSATDEASLMAAAERSLKEVLGVTVRLSTTPPPDDLAQVMFRVDGSTADPSVWVAVPRIAGERVLLSEDLTLLRSLGTVVTYLLENVLLQQRRQDQDLREQELRVQSSQSELKALRAQINPHFLFNALNTVASLIHSDPGRADRAVEQLSEVFRHTLRRSQNEWASLDGELSFAAAYLDVEEARFGSRLQYGIDASPDARRVQVPAMLVHTLIENAVKHGIAQVRGHGRIDVAARIADGRLHLTVSDSGPGPDGDGTDAATRPAGESFGLRSIRDRLRGHFGDAATFSLDRDLSTGMTVARVSMPAVLPDARTAAAREVVA